MSSLVDTKYLAYPISAVKKIIASLRVRQNVIDLDPSRAEYFAGYNKAITEACAELNYMEIKLITLNRNINKKRCQEYGKANLKLYEENEYERD